MPPDRNPSKPDVLAVGQRVFDRFYLRRLLGRGGMGVMWLAHDRVLEQEVALKFLADHLLHERGAVERLKHETRRNQKLSHPHIVRIHDFLQDTRRAAIMMEFVDGWSLATLKIDKPRQLFGAGEIKPWLLALCDALDYAHHHAGIVHHDLNPSNLMLNARGQLKITDFGMARTLHRTRTSDFVDLRVVGTDVYMSPQQWAGEPPTMADDIYSLGATVYELLTGKPPFYHGNIQDQVFDLVPPSLNERLRELGLEDVEIPDEFETTVAACLAKLPADRPATVKQVAALLRLTDSSPAEIAAVPENDPHESVVSEDVPPVAEIETPAEREPEVGLAPKTAPAGSKGIWAACGFAAAVGLIVWLATAAFYRRHFPAISGLAASAPGVFPQSGLKWENSLGMKFVPVPGVPGLLSIWETRLRDFNAYVAEIGRAPGNHMLSIDAANAWKENGHSWRNPEFEQSPDHPVVGVSWNEAVAFCDWLTTRERAAGWIATNQGYRLPTAAEFQQAAGASRFVWGDAWPPPKGAGNFAGEEIQTRLPPHPFISGYNDGYSGTAPVGSFAPNSLGLFDLAGNVCELCGDLDPNDRARRPWLAGGSWQDSTPEQLAVTNLSHLRPARRASDCGFRVILEFRRAQSAALSDE